MAKKIKFALEMRDGVKVRGIEELRDNFDIAKAVEHFTSGKLVEWLEDRYFDDEVKTINAIDKEAPSDIIQRQLCEALGVDVQETDVDEDLDMALVQRNNEKKEILRQKTSDQNIIAHAAQTAFNRDDLSDLWDAEESTIYLCGDTFKILSRITGRTYIGVLGRPKIEIDVNSREELTEKGIKFENVELPEHLEDIPNRVCPKCGEKVRGKAKFCDNCGASMEENMEMTQDNPPTVKNCMYCDCEIAEDETKCPVCGALLTESQETSASSQILTEVGNNELEKPAGTEPIVNPIAEDVEKMLSRVQGILSDDWWSLDAAPFLLIREYSGTKSEMKNAVRSAGDEYESDARDRLNRDTERLMEKMEDVQEQYDDLYEKSGKAYFTPQPSLNEVRMALSNGHNQILQGARGLGSTLVDRAKYDSWSADFFSPTEYSLENSDDLDSIAARFYERLVSQYKQMGIYETVRSYFRSVKRGLEKLQ